MSVVTRKHFKRLAPWLFALIGVLTFLFLLSGCNQPTLKPLMPTPVLISELGIEPLSHIPVDKRWTPRQVYYLTTRKRDSDLTRIDYTNQVANSPSVGITLVEFGDPGLDWTALNRLSGLSKRPQEIDLSISGIVEAGEFKAPGAAQGVDAKGATEWWLSELNASIESARDKDIMIYVHGAKVDFYNACVFAAQLDHFMGRDMTSIAFSWPTRQNIFAYGLGKDVARAYESAGSLADLLEVLAEGTSARSINLICWSAGGRVITKALTDLRDRHPELDREALQQKLRIGTVYYAAADVPGEEFLSALPALSAISRRIIVTVSSNDGALKNAERFMGGRTRIGQITTDISESERQLVFGVRNLEIVDLSTGSEERGFDIIGHRYWFDHPWASSDVILSIRSDLRPEERGLETASGGIHWKMPPDYPKRLKKSMLRRDLKLRQGSPTSDN